MKIQHINPTAGFDKPTLLCGLVWAPTDTALIMHNTWEFLRIVLRNDYSTGYKMCQACEDAVTPLLILKHTEL